MTIVAIEEKVESGHSVDRAASREREAVVYVRATTAGNPRRLFDQRIRIEGYDNKDK